MPSANEVIMWRPGHVTLGTDDPLWKNHFQDTPLDGSSRCFKFAIDEPITRDMEIVQNALNDPEAAVRAYNVKYCFPEEWGSEDFFPGHRDIVMSSNGSWTQLIGTTEVPTAEAVTTTTEVPAAEAVTTTTEAVTTTTEVPTTEAVTTITEVPTTEAVTTTTEAVTTTTEVPATEAVTTTTEVPATEAVTTTTEVPATEAVTTTTEAVTTTTEVPTTDAVTASTESTATTVASTETTTTQVASPEAYTTSEPVEVMDDVVFLESSAAEPVEAKSASSATKPFSRVQAVITILLIWISQEAF